MNESQDEKLTVYTNWCKLCGICMGFCPTSVIAIEDGKVIIANPDACVKCRLCEKLCPDYAIYFKKEGVGDA